MPEGELVPFEIKYINSQSNKQFQFTHCSSHARVLSHTLFPRFDCLYTCIISRWLILSFTHGSALNHPNVWL